MTLMLLYSGDIILEVNGKRVFNIPTILDAVGYEEDKVIHFRIRRENGDEQEISVRPIHH